MPASLAIICPGQGVQTPGMLLPWIEVPGASQLLGEWGERAKVDLTRLGTTAETAEVNRTENAQPLIVATGLLAATALHLNRPVEHRDPALSPVPAGPPEASTPLPTHPPKVLVAGHSLGAITAVALAGVYSFADAVAIAARRGIFMAEVAAGSPEFQGGMAAVIGAPLAEVEKAADAVGLDIATVNAENQVVVAGPRATLERFKPPNRARIMNLNVAGPFHTRAYQGAAKKLREELSGYQLNPPSIPIINDLDGTPISDDESGVVSHLVNQITNPVRWDKVTSRLADTEAIIELPPAGTLTRLVRRALSAQVLPINSPDDIPAGQALLAACMSYAS